MSKKINAIVVVLGAGPAGYSAAFRCADLGLETILIEKYDTLGGVCLNVGCVPSKALLHLSGLMKELESLSHSGLLSCMPSLNIEKICCRQAKIVGQLAAGLTNMARLRGVTVINGTGKLIGKNSIRVESQEGDVVVCFSNLIIAAGSRPIKLPFFSRKHPRVWDSTEALKLKLVPRRMLIVGGGIIGLEMGTIYHALGSQIDIVEISAQVIPAADEDIARAFTDCVKGKFNFMLETKVTAVEEREDCVYVSMEGKKAPVMPKRYDVVLVAVGRRPNGLLLGAEAAGVDVDEYGFINVNKQMRTNVPHIFAAGDIVGQPMLAHKGIHEGHIAAEVISGKKHYFEPKVIPSVAYTEPEVAWAGKTEKEAKAEGINYEVSKFPWSASGRAIASNCSEGLTKLIFDKDTNRIVGGAIVGKSSGELLGEIGLAIEMGCDAEDIALTVHAHPTLSESIGLAAEISTGTVTDLLNIKAKN